MMKPELFDMVQKVLDISFFFWLFIPYFPLIWLRLGHHLRLRLFASFSVRCLLTPEIRFGIGCVFQQCCLLSRDNTQQISDLQGSVRARTMLVLDSLIYSRYTGYMLDKYWLKGDKSDLAQLFFQSFLLPKSPQLTFMIQYC